MKNIVVLVSGGGTNLQALIDAEKSGIIKGGKITCVISSKEGAYALERAKNNDIPTRVIPRKEYSDSVSYSKAILEALNEEKADLVVLATGVRPADKLYYDCLGAQVAGEIYNIGDSFRGARIFEAVRSAYRCALNI